MHPARAAPFLYLIPVIGITSGTALLGESQSLTLVAGTLFVLASVAAAQHPSAPLPLRSLVDEAAIEIGARARRGRNPPRSQDERHHQDRSGRDR
jgi:hypothetical protein